jgi:hypothetical protein
MSDQDIIRHGVAMAEAENREIDDLTAKVIASQWHSGQTSALYALASSGAIVHNDVWGEVHDSYNTASAEDRKALDFLGTYLLLAGVRGPLSSWDDLTW